MMHKQINFTTLHISKFILWENFVFATLDFADFSYATLDFDISLLPLLDFDNYHNCHSENFAFTIGMSIVIIVKN